MSGGWLHVCAHGCGDSMCTEVGEGPLIPSCITFGMSTSGGGPILPSSLEGGVEAHSADKVSGRSVHLLEDAAPPEHLSTFLFLPELVSLCGAAEHCACETVLIWCNPCGWLPASDATPRSAAFLFLGWWDWSLDLVWNVNEGNLDMLFFLESWLELSRMLLVDWHFLLPCLTGRASGSELSNCGLT